jgi:hypothetical protein
LRGDYFDGRLHYRAVVRKLNFLEKGSRSEIAYSFHQCDRFSESLKESPVETVMQICCYLLLTREQGVVLDPQDGKSFEVYADADFCGNWNRSTDMNGVSTAKYITGYIISFYGCPITWASALKTHIALSTTEAEYIALTKSRLVVIPIVNIMTEINRSGVCNYFTIPKIYYKT